ncbi:unnamed protein product [Pedinophyceae sp. YPF-701]|nr:unnamed protein product [Pedinophyceae sp. YPF-701]
MRLCAAQRCLHGPSLAVGRARQARDVRAAAVRARWVFDARYGKKAETIALVQEWVESVGAAAGLPPGAARLSTGTIGAPESRLELEVELSSLAQLEEFWSSIPAAEHRAWSQRAQSVVIDGTPRWEVYHVVPLPHSSGAPAKPTAAANPTSQSSRILTPGPDAPPPKPALRGFDAGMPKPYSARKEPRQETMWSALVDEGLGAASSDDDGRAFDAGGAGEAGDGGIVMPSAEEIEAMATGGSLGPIDGGAGAEGGGQDGGEAGRRRKPRAGGDGDVGAGLPRPGDPVEGMGEGRWILDWKGEPMRINPGDSMPL